jgi:hypothetical protein
VKLLTTLHEDLTRPFEWSQPSKTKTLCSFEYDGKHTIVEGNLSNNLWSIDLTRVPLSANLISTLFNIVERHYTVAQRDNTSLSLRGYGDCAEVLRPICERLKLFYGCDFYQTDRQFIINENQIDDILTEEHNTSLMYHKLFPNLRLLRDLEAFGYKFEMGSGLKLHKQFFASKHRNKSAPTRQRTIQSLVIFKNGEMYRQIPKANWVMLVNPSDYNSKTWGEKFMEKLLAHEQKILSDRLALAAS